MYVPFVSRVKLHDFNKNTKKFSQIVTFISAFRFIMHSLYFDATFFSYFLPLIVVVVVVAAASLMSSFHQRAIFFRLHSLPDLIHTRHMHTHTFKRRHNKREQRVAYLGSKNEMQILKTIAWDDGLIKSVAMVFVCVRYGRSLSLFMMRQHLSRRLNKLNGSRRDRESERKTKKKE